MYNNKKNAFTLVELIVVITILAILGTIALISLQGYSAQARDSKRVSDVANIKKSLELFSLNTGKYPLPDSGVEYSFSGEVLWTQGVVGDQVSKNLSRNLNEKPIDPLSGEEYNYSTINSQTEYEVLGIYESDLVSTSPQPSPTGEGARPNVGANLVFAQQSYAATNNYPKITGTYNGIYVKTANYIFPSPSIVNALDIETDFKDETTAIQSQIITGGDNNITGGTGALSDLTMTYTGVINDDSSDAEKISVIETIQSFYSGTSLASIDEIANVLSKITDEEKKDLADFIVLNSGVVRRVEENIVLDNTSCKTILDTGGNNGNGTYTIDPEDNGTGFEVYCDMESDGGGWTLITNVIADGASDDLISGVLTSNFISGFDTAENIANVSNEIRYNCEASGNVIDIKTSSATWLERPYKTGNACSEGYNWGPDTSSFVDLSSNNYSRNSSSNGASCCCRVGHKLNTYPIGITGWGINDRYYNSWGRNCAGISKADYMRVWYR